MRKEAKRKRKLKKRKQESRLSGREGMKRIGWETWRKEI